MAQGPSRPCRVLLVEDDADHAELVRKGLAAHGDRVALTTLTDGEAAESYLFRRGEWSDPATSPRPDLILLDLRLPKLDGFELLREIKASAELAGIPAVVLTTSGAQGDIARAYSHQANSYLVKPVDYQGFMALVDGIESYWLGWNRRPSPDP